MGRCVCGRQPQMDPRALLDNLEAGVAAIGPDWTIVEWSAAAARMTGLAADRVLGQTFWTAFPLAQTTQIERLLREVLTTGRPRTYILPAGAPDVPGLVLETRVTRGPDDHLVMLFEPMRVELRSESREAQLLSAFEVERRLYLQLFNSLPAPALLLNPDGQILAVNPKGRSCLVRRTWPAHGDARWRLGWPRSTGRRSPPRCTTPSRSDSGCSSPSRCWATPSGKSRRCW